MRITCFLHTVIVLYVDIYDCCSADDNGSDIDLTACNSILFLNIDNTFGNSKPSVTVKDPSLTEQINKAPLIANVEGPIHTKSRKL